MDFGFGCSSFLLEVDLDKKTAAPGIKPRRSSIYAGAERVPLKQPDEQQDEDAEMQYLQKLNASMQGYFKTRPVPPPVVKVFYSYLFS
jgi:hypothetical protein